MAIKPYIFRETSEKARTLAKSGKGETPSFLFGNRFWTLQRASYCPAEEFEGKRGVETCDRDNQRI